MTINTDHYLRVNELKNYLYCPRTSYYSLCLSLERETDLSKAGHEAELTTKRQMKRRKRALHAVHEGDRVFDVALVSHVYEIVGRLDEMVVTEKGVYLIDYKDTDKDHGYWHVQMYAYQLAALEMGYNVLGCYVYSIPKKTYRALTFKAQHHQTFLRIRQELARMIADERCPQPIDHIGKCRVCQYVRFCNDVF
ncbi:MAG: CRISPR-associated protein Cas4 [Anaerolineae bacterium]|nr:CRISPR-associated protein Cas4 [Anaerolineae bacterium]MDW8170919.1 CRISPR-associated protein Cas4 [Anaerolineae bacterium]